MESKVINEYKQTYTMFVHKQFTSGRNNIKYLSVCKDKTYIFKFIKAVKEIL